MSTAARTPRAATSTVDRSIGYVARDMGGHSPPEIAALLADAGYGAVDWTMEQFEPLRDSPGRLEELVGYAHAAGLVVPQLLVHQDHVTLDRDLWERGVRRAECAVLACGHAGIDSIGALSGPSPWEPGAARVGVEISEAHAWELARRALERVLDRGEEEGVRVALEPCWGTLVHGRYRAEHLLAALDCAALAVNFDPSHHVLCGDDIPGAVRAWGGRIAHVHLKDAFGRRDPDVVGFGAGRDADGSHAGARCTEDPDGGARGADGSYAGARCTEDPDGGARDAEGSYAGARRTEDPDGGARDAESPHPEARGAAGPGASGSEEGDFTFLLPGEGVVPWAALFDALDAIGYTGAMSVENEAHRLLEGPLHGDLARSAALARELVAGLLDEPAGGAPGATATEAA